MCFHLRIENWISLRSKPKILYQFWTGPVPPLQPKVEALSIVVSRLDYCNSLLCGISNCRPDFSKMQCTLNLLSRTVVDSLGLYLLLNSACHFTGYLLNSKFATKLVCFTSKPNTCYYYHSFSNYCQTINRPANSSHHLLVLFSKPAVTSYVDQVCRVVCTQRSVYFTVMHCW